MLRPYDKIEIMPPLISVIIPCYNEKNHLPDLFAALARQTLLPLEVILVDGDSRDGSVDVARNLGETYPQLALRVLRNEARIIPRALNIGCGAARGTFLARMDGHAIPAADYLARGIALLERGATVSGGCWRILPGDSTLVATAIAIAAQTPLGAGDAAYRVGTGQKEPRAVETVPFGCFRKTTWEEVGGFDESLHINEDYEFFQRIRERGGTVWLDPEMVCDYHARPTLRALWQQYHRYGWWKVQMLKRHPKSLRIRQMIPPLWTALSLLLLLPVCLLPSPVTFGAAGGIGLIYIGILLHSGWNHSREWKLSFLIAAATVCIHFAWGLGFWRGWLRGVIPAP